MPILDLAAPPAYLEVVTSFLNSYLEKPIENSHAATAFETRITSNDWRDALVAAHRMTTATPGMWVRVGGAMLNQSLIEAQLRVVDAGLDAQRNTDAQGFFKEYCSITNERNANKESMRSAKDELRKVVNSEGASFSETWKQMETRPPQIEASVRQLAELMRRTAQLPVTSSTVALAKQLVRDFFDQQRDLCSLLIATEKYQFGGLLTEKQSVLQAASANAGIDTATRVLQAVMNAKSASGVRQTWFKCGFLLRYIDWIEKHPPNQLSIADQKLFSHKLIFHYISVFHALGDSTVLFPGVNEALSRADRPKVMKIISADSQHAAALKQAAPRSLPGNSYADSSQSSGRATAIQSASSDFYSELNRVGTHGREWFLSVVLLLKDDKDNSRGVAQNAPNNKGRSSKSREDMKAWADAGRDISLIYQELKTWAKVQFGEKSEEVLQRWEHVYTLAATVLSRYSEQFCAPKAAHDSASEWLSDHMKMLAKMGTARVVVRTQKGPPVKFKISSSTQATDKAEQIVLKPRLLFREIYEWNRIADDLIAKADRNYGTSSTPAPIFERYFTSMRCMEVRRMRADYSRALQRLDRLAEEPDAVKDRDLNRSLIARIQKCWERRVVLQAVLESPQIEMPLEDTLKPRWLDGLVQAVRPEKGDLIKDTYRIEPVTYDEVFDQYVRIQLNDRPIVVQLESGRLLEPFPVAPVFAHVHLRTTEATKIESLDEITSPEMIACVRLKIAVFDNISNEKIRKEFGFQHVPATDASNDWGFQLVQQVRANAIVFEP